MMSGYETVSDTLSCTFRVTRKVYLSEVGDVVNCRVTLLTECAKLHSQFCIVGCVTSFVMVVDGSCMSE
jgi:hypothetical protein